jgi:hypothetical protein
MTRDMTWPEGDWRNLYFPPDKLAAILDHVDALRPDVPAGMTMPELALRFIRAVGNVGRSRRASCAEQPPHPPTSCRRMDFPDGSQLRT